MQQDGSLSGQRLTSSIINQQIEQFKADLIKFVEWANEDARKFNAELEVLLSTMVTQRKQVLDETAELDATLEIPIRRVGRDRRVEVPV